MFLTSPPYYIEESECGYCHGKKHRPHITIGANVERMLAAHYDLLINRGFRRSGGFVYKTDLLRNCCQYYTIRTSLDMMKVTKEHRQTANRWARAIGAPQPRGKVFSLETMLAAESQSTRFHTRFEPSVFSEEKYQLYRKYQIHVHNDEPDDISEESFSRFLCESPFPEEEQDGHPEEWDALNNWASTRVGPTHECYYLDGKLIAVSILDFLPSGLSSIYFIWDPDYAHLSLGTVLGLREILMCKKLGLGYYYLGYYIDDCAKMSYKRKFGGELLDVCTETYYPIEEARKNLGLFLTCQEKEERFLRGTTTAGPVGANTSDMYEGSAIFDAAKHAQAEVTSKLCLGTPARGVLCLPLVVPGLMPYTQVLELVRIGKLDLNTPVRVFSTQLGELVRQPFGSFSPDVRQLLVNVVRVFGVEFVGAIVIT